MNEDPWEKCVRAAHNMIKSTKNKTLVEAQHAGLSSSQRSTELSSHFLQFICGTPELQLARPWLTGTLGPWDLGSKSVACRWNSCRLSSIGPHLGSLPTDWQWGLLFVRLKKDLKIFFSCSTMIFLYKEWNDSDCSLMVFHTSASYVHENSFHYFKDYLMTKLTLG
jgi:hypothetical protein